MKRSIYGVLPGEEEGKRNKKWTYLLIKNKYRKDKENTKETGSLQSEQNKVANTGVRKGAREKGQEVQSNPSWNILFCVVLSEPTQYFTY